MTTCESHWGINGPCKIVCKIDGTKTGKKSGSFSGRISDGLSVVLVRAEPHKGCITERVQSSAA